jgi:uncharacterized membrane protein
MADRRSIGNIVAPARFIVFVVAMAVAIPLAWKGFGDWNLGVMGGFDVAAIIFLLSVLPLLSTRHGSVIEGHARDNDANRAVLLGITAIVMLVLLVSIAAEAVGNTPQPFTKILIIVTLALAWLFSNSIYALHYAHLAYGDEDGEACSGISFPGTEEPVYWDFVYFAFTLGMTFQTSDVEISSQHIRRVVTLHSLAAFVFNIGVLAFTINVLGSR